MHGKDCALSKTVGGVCKMQFYYLFLPHDCPGSERMKVRPLIGYSIRPMETSAGSPGARTRTAFSTLSAMSPASNRLRISYLSKCASPLLRLNWTVSLSILTPHIRPRSSRLGLHMLPWASSTWVTWPLHVASGKLTVRGTTDLSCTFLGCWNVGSNKQGILVTYSSHVDGSIIYLFTSNTCSNFHCVPQQVDWLRGFILCRSQDSSCETNARGWGER